MKKVFFAIGHRAFEDALKGRINKSYKDTLEFVGDTVYKEGIINGVEAKNPDIIIIRETLNGSTAILEIIYNLRAKFPNVRIIFIAKNSRQVGDALLSSLVSYGVYDILLGEKTNLDDIFNLINKPNKINDVLYLQAKMKVDEKSNNVIFEAPKQQPIKKVEVIRYIDNTKIIEDENKDENKNENKIDVKLGNLDSDLIFEKVEEKKKEVSVEPKLEINEVNKFSIEKVDEKPKNINIDTEKIKVELLKQAEFEKNKALEQIQLEKEKVLKQAQIEKEKAMKQAEMEKLEKEKALKQAQLEKEKAIKQAEIEKEKAIKIAEERARKETLVKMKKQEKETEKVEKDKQQLLEEFNKLKNSTFTGSNKQKIISFVGAKHGCGNTQIAFNTALNLASSGKKVIYLEISNNISTIGYTYQIYNKDYGIETALKGLANNLYDEVDKSIISLGGLINNVDKKNVLYDSYKMLPKTLDVMFISENYIEENNYLKSEDFSKEYIKELYLYLMYQKSYDVLIIDISGDINPEILHTSVIYSNKVFFTLTQDVNTISQCIYRINLMNKNRINLKEKIYYIINKYDSKARLGIGDIEEWLGERIECNVVSALEEYNRLFIDSNYIGLPILLNSPNRSIKQAFNQITTKINE